MHDDVVRKIFVEAAKSVAEPRAKAGATGDLAAGLNECDRRVVVDGFRVGAVDDAQLFRHLRGMRQQLADPDAVGIVAVFREFILAGTDGKAAFLVGRHAGNALPVANVVGQLLVEHLTHLWLVIPHVEVTGAAAHKEVDDVLCFGRMMHALQVARGRVRARSKITAQKACKCGGSHPECRAAEQLPPSGHEIEFTKRIRLWAMHADSTMAKGERKSCCVPARILHVPTELAARKKMPLFPILTSEAEQVQLGYDSS